MADPCLTILPIKEVIGLSFMAFTGFLSAGAVIFVLCLVARNYMRNVRNPPPGGEWKLIRTHVDAYLLSLLASDLVQSVGAILEVKWVAERQVYCSPTCTTQGIIKVIGETGVAMGTLAIAVHTFLVIFFRWSPSPRSSWIWKVVITLIWLYVCLYSIVGYATHHRNSDSIDSIDAFYTPAPYWCWISNKFNTDRIPAEYLWFWLAAFISVVLYTLLFFRVRGNITVDPLNWWGIRFKWHRWRAGDEGDGYFDGPRGGEAGNTAAREAMSMIWYPVMYTALILPLSLVRWLTFSSSVGPNMPFAASSVVITIFGLSGIVNVVLILLTRKNLLLFGQRGVVNPAKIGPAAISRLSAAAARNNQGGTGGVAEKKDGFHFRNMVVGRHHSGKQEIGEDSMAETDKDQGKQRCGDGEGDTSFVAGWLTTQAFETQRSSDLGSSRLPFSPITAPTDTPNTTIMHSGIVMMDEEQSYGYGYGYVHEQGGHTQDGGIPEGMSRDLGSPGEYDVDRNRDWWSFGSAQPSATLAATPIHHLMSGDHRGGGGHGHISEGETTQADMSNPLNFLDLKDSRSNSGQLELLHAVPHYPPQPSHQHPTQHLPPAQLYAEGGRGSAGKPTGGSGPNNAKSRTNSSYHRPSWDVNDYNVPMKLNPTPAHATTITTRAETEVPDAHSPYGGKSWDGSSKPLGKTTTPISTTTTPTKLPWSGVASMFSKFSSLEKPDRSKYGYGPSPHNSGQSDSRLLAPPAAAASTPPAYPQEPAQIRPLHFSHDFGPKLQSSLSLRTSDTELEQSPFDDPARLEKAASHEAHPCADTHGAFEP